MEDDTFRIITLGSYGTGKTTLLLKASSPESDVKTTYICTLGVDFKTKVHIHNGITYQLRIWDTAGQEKFYHINRLYYKDTDAVLLVYDIGNIESFKKIDHFYEDFCKFSNLSAATVLVGTKSDSDKREVSQEMAQEYANRLRIPYIECSAYLDYNVSEIFSLAIEQILAKSQQKRPESLILRSSLTPAEKKTCLCSR